MTKKVTIFLERENKELSIETNANTIKDLMNELNLDISRHVIVKNGEISTEDEEINDGDYIKILDVVSGG